MYFRQWNANFGSGSRLRSLRVDFSLGFKLGTLGVVIGPFGIDFRLVRVKFRPLGAYFGIKTSILGLCDPMFWALEVK